MLRILFIAALLVTIACAPAQAKSDSDIKDCIAVLAWLSVNHQHYYTHTHSEFDLDWDGRVTGKPAAKLKDDETVKKIVNESCGPFIDPAVLDAFR